MKKLEKENYYSPCLERVLREEESMIDESLGN